MPPIRCALIGAGQRGRDVYGRYALDYPDKLQIIAVAEPNPARRERFALAHMLPAASQFAAWEDLLAAVPDADAIIIANPDAHHIGPALAALRAGYHVLLEKPMATTLADSVTLTAAAEDAGRLLQIAHELRYTPFFMALYDVVRSGRLGDVVTVEHRENVSYYHMAHSFVRGNWGNSAESSPMILAKCCHDLDILTWTLGEEVTRLSSVGSLRHFRADQAPHPDVPPRCIDGCPVADQCPFDATAIYLDHRPFGGWDPERLWPNAVLASGDLSRPAIEQALRDGPYGRCVYRCANDVVDHQIVTMETDAGTSVALIMHGHSHLEGRTMRWDGTRATLEGRFTGSEQSILIHDHLTNTSESIPIPQRDGAHGGGDAGLLDAFVASITASAQGHAPAALTDARASLESHLLAFAAEQARLEASVIDMAAFRASAAQLTQ